MAAKQTKANRTRHSASKKVNSSIFSYLILGGFLLLAAFGWFHSIIYGHDPEITDLATVDKDVVKPIPNIVPSKKESKNNTDSLIWKIPVPNPLASLDQPANVLAAEKRSTVVPYKPDTQLPPPAKFAVHNAANIIFAKEPTIIYTKADSRSKIAARVKMGQEMRSYEHTGAWHRVVVPSTNIIGWANDKSLSEKSPNLTDLIDRAMTGAITP